MSTETDPIIGNWYRHLDKGQCFIVVAIDDIAGSVEMQWFDGSLEEIGLDGWYDWSVEVCEAPENWVGAFDVENPDDLDLGSSITDTSAEDWNEPLRMFPRGKSRHFR